MTSTIKINPTHDPDSTLEIVLKLMEATSDRDVEVEFDFGTDTDGMVEARHALCRDVCAAGYHAANNGNSPGFYIIRHNDDEPDWRKQYRYMSVFCGRVTFTKENA